MELEQLYRDVILDHARQPRNARALADADLHAQAHNALCGDRLEAYLKLSDARISEVGVLVRGCAICQASASMTSELIGGLSLAETRALGASFQAALVAGGEPDEALEPLLPLLRLRGQKTRHRCALLVWEALADCAEATGETAK